LVIEKREIADERKVGVNCKLQITNYKLKKFRDSNAVRERFGYREARGCAVENSRVVWRGINDHDALETWRRDDEIANLKAEN